MTNTERFFFENAGYSYDPKTQTEDEGRKECARKLAEAEMYAVLSDWSCDWVEDGDADPNDWDGEGPIGNEAYGCILRDSNGHLLESLWSIWDPSPEYRRVVEAELADEAIQHKARRALKFGSDHVLVLA